MENLDNEVNCSAYHLRSNLSDVVLLSHDDLNIMNLESSNPIPAETNPISLDQENEQNTGISTFRESEIISSQAFIRIPIFNDISYFNTDTGNNEFNSSVIKIQNDSETIFEGTKWRI